LKRLIEIANKRIIIMPGGGLRSDNIVMLNEITAAEWCNSAAITDGGEIANSVEVNALKSNLLQ
jgi:copper homeostasis protein